MSGLPTIKDVLTQQGVENDDLLNALIEREALIAEGLMLNGMQFGAHPPIVAEVIRVLGLGRPLSEDENILVHRNFENHMKQLQEDYERQQREQGEGGA